MPTLSDWLAFLSHSHTWVALPFLVGGLALMVFGWRLSRPVSALTFAGATFGTVFIFAAKSEQQWIIASGGAVAAFLLSFAIGRYSIALLAGTVGSGLTTLVCRSAGMNEYYLMIGAAISFIACGALSALNLRQVAVIVTSFQGAVLFLSGITAMVMAAPSIYSNFKGMADGNYIVLPFMLLVPTVMSCFYQLADIRRADSPT